MFGCESLYVNTSGYLFTGWSIHHQHGYDWRKPPPPPLLASADFYQIFNKTFITNLEHIHFHSNETHSVTGQGRLCQIIPLPSQFRVRRVWPDWGHPDLSNCIQIGGNRERDKFTRKGTSEKCRDKFAGIPVNRLLADRFKYNESDSIGKP